MTIEFDNDKDKDESFTVKIPVIVESCSLNP